MRNVLFDVDHFINKCMISYNNDVGGKTWDNLERNLCYKIQDKLWGIINVQTANAISKRKLKNYIWQKKKIFKFQN